MLDDSAESEARWDAAAQLAEGIHTPTSHRRRSRAAKVLLIVAVSCIALAAVAAGLALALGWDGPGSAAPETSVARVRIQQVLTIAGLAVWIGGTIWLWRIIGFARPRQSIVTPLNPRERIALGRQASQKDPVDDRRRGIVVAFVQQFQDMFICGIPLFSGMILLGTGLLIRSTEPLLTLVAIPVLAVCFAGLAGSFFFVRKYGRFIDTLTTSTAG